MNNLLQPACRARGIMAILLMALLAPLCAHGNSAQASTLTSTKAVPFVEYNRLENTLTFKYGDKPANAGVYKYYDISLQSNYKYTEWWEYTGNVKKVIFDPGFKDFHPTTCRNWLYGCNNLKTIEGMENLNTDKVKDMRGMFENCNSLTTLDVSNFNTDSVTDMINMFYGCSKLTKLDVPNFNTTNVTDMTKMFYGCSSLDTLDLSNFNTAKVTDMREMFSGCKSLAALDVSKFNTANVTNMNRMFRDCSKLATLDLSNFNTANVKDMLQMFYNCSKLKTLDLQNFNTAKVTDMQSMFSGCSNLTALDLSNFNTANVTDMSYMFQNCPKLTALDVSKFNTAKVENMESMFDNCNSLTTLDLPSFNTANVKNMLNMFSDCFNLAALDLSNFNTANVTDMTKMFFNCSALQTIYVSDLFKASSGSNVFKYCKKLRGATAYTEGSEGTDWANYEKGYFTKKVGTNGNDIIGATGNPLTVETLALDDSKAFALNEPCNVNVASYTRSMNTETEWATLCLPYTIDAASEENNCRFYTLSELGDNSVMLELVESGLIAAGKPVFVRKKDKSQEEISILSPKDAGLVTAPASETGGNRPVGTFATTELSDNHYFLANDKFRLVRDYKSDTQSVKLAAFRAYIQPPMQAAGRRASVLNIGVSGEITAVDTPEVTNALNNATTEYYDLEGRRIKEPQKGVNIVKTGNKVRKVIIK